MNMKKIPKWKKTGMLTATRVDGKIGFNRNGGCVDIWIRDASGRPNWYAVDYEKLLINLVKAREHGDHFYLYADSDMGGSLWPGPIVSEEEAYRW